MKKLALVLFLIGCGPNRPILSDPEPVTPQPQIQEPPAWIEEPPRLETELFCYGPDGRPIWKITAVDSIHPMFPAGAEQLGIDWPEFYRTGRIISSSKQTGPMRVYEDPAGERPRSAASNETMSVALMRNPFTGQTLPREERATFIIAGARCTVASIDSLSMWPDLIRWEGIGPDGVRSFHRAPVPVAGEWTPLASAVIVLDGVPDSIPADVLARARAGQWDEEYRNPGYLVVGLGGQAVSWPIEEQDGMYREPDGWVRKVRVMDDGRAHFLRVRGRDSTICRPWLPGWSPSYEEAR